jgi:hypothetical protein
LSTGALRRTLTHIPAGDDDFEEEFTAGLDCYC